MSSALPQFIKFPNCWLREEWEREPSNIPTESEVADELERLLQTSTGEEDVQKFFERYPHVLPGLDTFHNGPMCDMVLSKFPLGTDFVTDFAFVTENSQMAQITCVEIEAPGKRIFRKDGSFHRDYIQARQQLADWNMWAQQNLRSTMRMFAPMYRCLTPDWLEVTLRCILVIGRRDEITTRKRNERWAAEGALRAASMTIMTYDRLLERIRSGWYWALTKRMVVCSYRDRHFEVKSVAI